jgi:hypothetical protein
MQPHNPSEIKSEINEILKNCSIKSDKIIEKSFDDISMILKRKSDMDQNDILNYLDELEYFIVLDEIDFNDDRFLFALNSIHSLFIF